MVNFINICNTVEQLFATFFINEMHFPLKKYVGKQNLSVLENFSSGVTGKSDVLLKRTPVSQSVTKHHIKLKQLYICACEPGSSVSAVSDYGLYGRGSIPDRDRGFFL
jgi:hypothetical protein